mmetsp:Transcript_17247/g.67110  ORF Transcript_17247/g.67110 Transcript_17247/m.67110 type:complete len:249 (+) Transcript_17247:312-1058(+)
METVGNDDHGCLGRKMVALHLRSFAAPSRKHRHHRVKTEGLLHHHVAARELRNQVHRERVLVAGNNTLCLLVEQLLLLWVLRQLVQCPRHAMGGGLVSGEEEVPAGEGDVVFIQPLASIVSVGEEDVEEIVVLHALLVHCAPPLRNDPLYNAPQLRNGILAVPQALGHVEVEEPRRDEVVRPRRCHHALHQHAEVVVVVAHRIDLQSKCCLTNYIQGQASESTVNVHGKLFIAVALLPDVGQLQGRLL